eukprot:TRINITY_DN24656_c0_g1_i1.p1 TRINITY_DN24656_c0_g1~~TRINITY_DN24656_c0_g1_i1.p1  ORF type:complete len:355 (+),score=86.89 TRINITY_DN24656_c0_g1_i1:57-1121(+)
MHRANRIAAQLAPQARTSPALTEHKADQGSPLIQLHPAVAEALARGGPVVALESTIISHGMPYPQNVETAREVEAIVRHNGAVPATIAILNGAIRIGLADEELEQLGRAGLSAQKVSRRDIASCVAQKLVGATTVSATMLLAHMAGIRVFVTGGCGGVHRGDAMDVSADLTELGRTPVAVVCAGIKSILDIPRSLEYLETMGVSVLTVGSNEFPAFFSRASGVKAPRTVAAEGAARTIAGGLQVHHALDLAHGTLVAVPIPEADDFGKEIDSYVNAALVEADEKGVKGADITPFLLDKVNKLTAGRSLTANIALVKNNAEVGAGIAVELSKLENPNPGELPEPGAPNLFAYNRA